MSAWTVTGAIGTITALIIGGYAIYARVENQRAMEELQQQIDAADAAFEEELAAQEAEQARQEAEAADIAEAWPDDIDVELESSHYTDEYSGTTVPYTVTNTSGRTAMYDVEITIVDPDNPSDIYDSTTITTPTLAPGETTHGTLYFTSFGGDWPKSAEGRYQWNVASATGYEA